ncbi:MAG TPA: HlyD family efflux transporter periplasmic adaptor subunit, partial [Candidatus Ozemobacteraceae bacterium]|nr:HlyD family efflux transporter periplasmic adaptor subunit [Candidatus Ozemobacteraceae bacterium]
MKKIGTLILILGVFAVFAASRGFTSMREQAQPVQFSGNIEVDETELSFKTPGRVIERAFSEGDILHAGALVARLDDVELKHDLAIKKAERSTAEAALKELEAGSRPEEIAQAEASVRRFQAQLSELLAGTRSEEIAAVQAAMTRAQAEADIARSDLSRQQRLYDKQAIAIRDLDHARTAAETAKARLSEAEAMLQKAKAGPRREQIEAARSALSEAKERLALVKRGPRMEAIVQAQARVALASCSVALSRTRLDNALLFSPVSGHVLSHQIQPGEYVSPGTPVVTIANLASVWMRAYAPETDLGMLT